MHSFTENIKNPRNYIYIVFIFKSRDPGISKMQLFVTIIDAFQSLSITTKSHTLNEAKFVDPQLNADKALNVNLHKCVHD